MQSTELVTCPHCEEFNENGVEYCEACGMAVPVPGAGGPRIVEGNAFATTVLGQQLQSEELQKQAKKATGALLLVAVIQTLVLAVILLISMQNPRFSAELAMKNTALLGIAASDIIFWGLFFWSRVQPLPAAIVGLIFYSTLITLNVVIAVSQAKDGIAHNGGFGGLGIGWLDIVIIVVLAQAISAGSKYRKMMQANAAGQPLV